MLDTKQKDYRLGLDVIKRLVGPKAHPHRVIVFVTNGVPVAKLSGRLPNQLKRVVDEEQLIRGFASAIEGRSFAGPVAVAAVFFRPDFFRIDADNMMKLVLDAGTKAKAWSDDCYIVAQASYVELDDERPRTIIALASAVSSLDRSKRLIRFKCVVCGTGFTREGRAARKNPPKFCSRVCFGRSCRYKHGKGKCLKCGVQFVKNAARQRYCSRECAARVNSQYERNTLASCQVCGAKLAKQHYKLCRKCWLSKAKDAKR
jgi:Holliday junction resolvase RusA-like endonuclease